VVKPEIVTGEEEPVPLTVVPSDVFLAVATYPVIADPPTLEGAVNVTETAVGPAVVAVPIVGALGTSSGS
tara:strand:- start:537 stop:746 length:210 start_codon:yes stop_codon:yes gene_type:complete